MKLQNKKAYVTYDDIERFTLDIVREIMLSDWKPDYIVGIGRGGLLPATLMSHFLNVPMNSLDIGMRDGGEQTSNAWMAEDAFGYVSMSDRDNEEDASTSNGKNILIVDDINDSGETLTWLQHDWMSGCLPDHKAWEKVWNGGNVRIACLFNNESSDFKHIDYSAITINKAEKDVWVVFPWEDWWKSKP
jgi:hypoxanthine phosphoribosyltransferase